MSKPGHLLAYDAGLLLFRLAMLLPGRLWMFEGAPLWWAVPLVSYYAHHVGPWWRAPEA